MLSLAKRRLDGVLRLRRGPAGLVVLMTCAGLACASAAYGDTATVGELSLTPTVASLAFTGQEVPVFQGDTSGGYVLSVPHDGVITSWSFLSGGLETGSTFVLRRLQPSDATDTSWRASGVSAPVAITSATGTDAINGPFATSIPVSAGDRIALQPVNGSDIPIEAGVTGADGIRYFAAPLAEGSSATLPGGESDNGQIVPVQAIESYVPSSEVSGPPPVPVNTAPPLITGTPEAGQTLTCTPGTWTNSPSYTYTWAQSTYRLIAGTHPPRVVTSTTRVASGPTYRLADLQPDVAISCTVTASNAATGPLAGPQATSAPVAVQAIAPVLAPRGLLGPNIPKVVGHASRGGTDLCDPGRWLHYPSSLTYKWYEKGYSPSRHFAYATLVGSGAKLTIPLALELHSIYCEVTASNAAGSAKASSAAVLVPQSGPQARGSARIQIDDPGPARVEASSGPANALQAGPDKRFLFRCLAPSFSPKPKDKLTYEWQVDLHGFFPDALKVAGAEVFIPDLTLSGPELTVTPVTPPVAVSPVEELPGHDLSIDGGYPQEDLTGGAPSQGEGTYGDLTIRCLVTATLPHAHTTVSSGSLYVLAHS